MRRARLDSSSRAAGTTVVSTANVQAASRTGARHDPSASGLRQVAVHGRERGRDQQEGQRVVVGDQGRGDRHRPPGQPVGHGHPEVGEQADRPTDQLIAEHRLPGQRQGEAGQHERQRGEQPEQAATRDVGHHHHPGHRAAEQHRSGGGGDADADGVAQRLPEQVGGEVAGEDLAPGGHPSPPRVAVARRTSGTSTSTPRTTARTMPSAPGLWARAAATGYCRVRTRSETVSRASKVAWESMIQASSSSSGSASGCGAMPSRVA